MNAAGARSRPSGDAGIGTETDHVRTQLIQQGGDLLLRLEDPSDVGVMQRAKTLGLQHLADDSAVLDGQAKPISIEVRTHRRSGHPAGDSHRGDHGPVETELHLCGRELLGTLDFFGDVDRLVEW